MKKRGASEALVYVLLVGFVIGMAIIVINWATPFSKELTESSIKMVDENRECQKASINVVDKSEGTCSQFEIKNTGYIKVDKVITRSKANNEVEIIPVITIPESGEQIGCKERLIVLSCNSPGGFSYEWVETESHTLNIMPNEEMPLDIIVSCEPYGLVLFMDFDKNDGAEIGEGIGEDLSGLRGLWHFNGDVLDDSGLGNDGTVFTLNNSGFEGGSGIDATYWEEGAHADRSSDKAYYGSWSMKFVAPTSAQATDVRYQDVKSGTTYTLSGWVWNNLDAGTNAYLDLSDIAEDCHAFSTQGNNAWEFVSCQFTSQRDDVKVRLVTDGGSIGSNTGDVWFDQINIAESGVGGKLSGGIAFDGVDDYVGIPYDESLDTGADLTMSAWIYWDGGAGDQNILTKEDSYEFRVNNGEINYATNPWVWRGSTDSQITPGTWQHVVITHDGDGLQKIYIGGVEKYSDNSGGSILTNSYGLTIGARYGGTASFFNGKIDEVAIYSRTLSPSEITDLYERGIAEDTSENNNDGSIRGPTTTAGKSNEALEFDGLDDYVDVEDSTDLESVPITVSAWFIPYDTNREWQFIAGKSNYWTADDYGLHMYYDRLEFFVTSDCAHNNYSTISENQWHHAVGVYDGTNRYLYVDGVLQITGLCSGKTFANGFDFTIGADNDGDYVFDGKIDDVMIWNRALSEEEIARLYDCY